MKRLLRYSGHSLTLLFSILISRFTQACSIFCWLQYEKLFSIKGSSKKGAIVLPVRSPFTVTSISSESARLIFLTSLPIFLVLALFPQWILSIFGKEFPGNENALYILLAGQFIVCFCGLPSQILNMAGRQDVLRNIAVFSAIINVLLCIFLIPPYGLMGACYAQLGGTFIWNLLSLLSVKKHFGFYGFFNLSFKDK